MPSRSSSRKKSNRHLKKPNNTNKPFTSQPNRHSSPALQSQDELDPNILREQNGRNGNCPVKKPNSGKCRFLVVEDKKKKGFSDTTGHNEMEGSVEETQKVLEESESEDKQVVGLDEEKVKTIVESDAAQVLAETQPVEEEQDSITVEKKEEESSSLVEPEKIRDASELIVDDIKELEAELKQKANQEQDSQETEPLALETETSREAEAGVDQATTTEADVADKLDSSEEKKESSSIETNEALLISESSVPQTDVASRATPIVKAEESAETPILEPEESGETKLPAEEQKVEESTVVKESSKEEEEEQAKEPLPPSDVAAAETTSTTMQEKTEIPTGTESQQTTVNQAPREYSSWSSCCGIFDFLSR